MEISALELTRELIRFKSVNPPGDERPCAEHLARMLEAAGFKSTLLPFGPGRAQLIARIGGSADQLPLAFTGHLDTVPLGAQPWSCDPFAAEIKDGKLYGRGSSDMKSGVAAFVTAAIRLSRFLGDTAGLLLVMTAGEETGCAGAFDLARRNELGKAGALVVAEPTGNRPLAGHKGALWLTAETRGVTAHGSMPDRGVNAIYKAARAVTALEHFKFSVTPHPVLGAPTLNVGTIQGGLNINSVPDRAVIGIDIRTVPSLSHAELRRALSHDLGPEVALTPLVDVESVWSDPQNAWMAEVRETTTTITGESFDIAAAPYFTDASALKPALGSPPAVILGPGELALAHQTDEYCLVHRIEQAVEIYTTLIRKWCGL